MLVWLREQIYGRWQLGQHQADLNQSQRPRSGSSAWTLQDNFCLNSDTVLIVFNRKNLVFDTPGLIMSSFIQQTKYIHLVSISGLQQSCLG